MKQNTTSPMTLREWLPLVGLTISAFIFNSSEFMPIGLLTDIASTFDITEAHAGLLMVFYAWTVMIMSLPLMIAASRVEYRLLLLCVIAFFGICQVFSAISTSFAMLMASRIGVACAHAIFWSIAAPLGVQVVSKSHQALALSAITTGTSIAMVFGLPLGRMVGLYMGWRMPFALVAATSFLVCFYLIAVFPKVPSPGAFSLKELPGLFHNPALMALYLLVFLTSSAYFTGYSYIEPFLLQVAGLSDDWVTAALMIFGGVGILGTFLFARFYPWMRLAFIALVIISMTASLFLLLPAARFFDTSILICAFWGVAATMYNVTINSEVIRVVTLKEAAVATSMMSGIYNLGIGFGTWTGGIVTSHLSIAYVGIAGGAMGIFAILSCLFCFLPSLRKRGNRPVL